GAYAHEPAAVEDADAVGGLLDLPEHVGPQAHGPPTPLRLAHERDEPLLHQRLQAARRPLQDQEPGPAHASPPPPELLLVALREGTHAPAEVEAEAFGQPLDRAGGHGPAEPREVLEQLAHARPALEPQLAGQVPDPAPQGRAALPRVVSEHAHGAD